MADFNIISKTIETDSLSSDDLDKLKCLAGKNAGICYMKDDYFSSKASSSSSTLKRFYSVIANGHNSIADHIQIEVKLSGISKMLAIVLNSLQCYATSEKSGRYTDLSGSCSEREKYLYNKWLDIFHIRVLELYPTYDDKILLSKLEKEYPNSGCQIIGGKLITSKSNLSSHEVNRIREYLRNIIDTDMTLPSWKIAQENARYILSVFTPATTMGYTTSLSQWNYIYDWCQKYLSRYTLKYDKDFLEWVCTNGKDGKCIILNKATNTEASYFETRLYFDFLNLSNFIYDNLYIEELRDNKNRCFEFLTQLSGVEDHPMKGYDLSCYEPDGYTGEYTYHEDTYSPDDYFGLVYNTSYTASFVQIAQAERHRTLKYFMFFNPSAKNQEYYIPPMIRNTPYAEGWIENLKSIEDLVPQATKVCIVETGHVSDFVLKCKERLCGRAQLEIMNQTCITARKYLRGINEGRITNNACINYLSSLYTQSGNIRPKCKMINCKEPCYWGSNKALDRLI